MQALPSRSHLAIQIALRHDLSVTLPNSENVLLRPFFPKHTTWTDADLPKLATKVEFGCESSV